MKFNTKELKEFLSKFIDNNIELQNKNRNPISLEITGPAGLGKTSCIEQIGEEKNLSVIKINLAQLEELGDLVGFPITEHEICNSEGECKWVDEISYPNYLNKGYTATDRRRMSYAQPEWIEGVNNNGGILLLDDWTRADQRFIQACMELIHRQTYISWKLPKNWTICLTSNPSGDADYVVTEIDRAQKTRFMSCELKFDKKIWAEWAEGKIDGRCINFLLLHPELITQNTNARAVTTFFNSISSIPVFEDQLPLISMLGEGSVGPEFSNAFILFINNKLDKLVSPEVMLFDKDYEKVKTLLKLATGTGDKYRADIASVLATRFSNFTSLHAETKPVDDDALARITSLCIDNIFGNDLQYYVVRELMKNKQKFQKLMMNPKVVQMATK